MQIMKIEYGQSGVEFSENCLLPERSTDMTLAFDFTRREYISTSEALWLPNPTLMVLNGFPHYVKAKSAGYTTIKGSDYDVSIL